MDLPNPRPDKLCVDCVGHLAVTNDSRFCRRCFKKRLDQVAFPKKERTLSRRGTAQIGRPARWSHALGGTPYELVAD